MTDTTTNTESAVFNITFRDVEHFNNIVKWLNANVGHGKDNWTMNGRILRHLKRGKEITRAVIIHNKEFDIEGSLYLTLI